MLSFLKHQRSKKESNEDFVFYVIKKKLSDIEKKIIPKFK
jgi:hypothetical protein